MIIHFKKRRGLVERGASFRRLCEVLGFQDSDQPTVRAFRPPSAGNEELHRRLAAQTGLQIGGVRAGA